MEINNKDQKLFFNGIRQTYYKKYNFSAVDISDSNFYNFKISFYTENQTPLNSLYIQYIQTITYDSQKTTLFYPPSLSGDFSKLPQSEYCFVRPINKFNAYMGLNQLKVSNEYFNTYPILRKMNYQNRKKNYLEHIQSLDLGLPYSNNGLAGVEPTELEIGTGAYTQNLTTDTNIYNNFFRLLNVGVDQTVTSTVNKLIKIPLSYLDPFFDNDVCLPPNFPVTLEFSISQQTFEISRTQSPSFPITIGLGVNTSHLPCLFMTQYSLQYGVHGNLARNQNISFNSKTYEVIERPALIDTSTDYYFNFKHSTYKFLLTAKTILPNALHFFITQKTFDQFAGTQFTYYNDTTSTYIPGTNYNNCIAPGLALYKVKITTPDNKIKLLNINNTFSKCNDEAPIQALNQDFFLNYGEPNYYNKIQMGTHYLTTSPYTFLINPNFFSKDHTKVNDEISTIFFNIEYKQATQVNNTNVNGPWNYQTNKQTLTFVLEYSTRFIIDSADTIHMINNLV